VIFAESYLQDAKIELLRSKKTMSAPASIPKRLLITCICSLALFGAFVLLTFEALTANSWDSLGAWVLLLLLTCLFGIAQLVLTIILAARKSTAKSKFVQIFSMHNLVWFLGLLVLAIIVDVEAQAFLIFVPGILISGTALLMILVREQEDRKEDPDLTDF
jgi:hypothetical protein